MKKIALLLVVAAFAATPAAAASKHHKKSMAKPKESVFAKQSANTMRILRDGMPLVLPSWSLPVYFGTGMDTSGHTAAKHHSKHHSKHHKKKM